MHSNLTNNHEGRTMNTSSVASTESIASNGSAWYGPIEFDFTGSTWTLTDELNIDNDTYGDLTITRGELSSGGNSISLTDDWTVETAGIFTHGSATVTFDGQNSTGESQFITINGTGKTGDSDHPIPVDVDHVIPEYYDQGIPV
jgi:hypothetical protein